MDSIDRRLTSALYLLRQGGVENGEIGKNAEMVSKIAKAAPPVTKLPAPAAPPPVVISAMPAGAETPPDGWISRVESVYIMMNGAPRNASQKDHGGIEAGKDAVRYSEEEAAIITRNYTEEAQDAYKASVDHYLSDPSHVKGSNETEKRLWELQCESYTKLNERLAPIRAATYSSRPEPTAWEKELKGAFGRAAFLIGNVMMANTKFHPLEFVRPADNSYGAQQTADFYNRDIARHNNNADDISLHGVMNMGIALDTAGVGNVVHQKENGEYKLSAFQIRSQDGKLVSELTEKGHYIEYNEDGTVKSERDRAETSAMPSQIGFNDVDAKYGERVLQHRELYEDVEFF